MRSLVVTLSIGLLLAPEAADAQIAETHPEVEWLAPDEPDLREAALALGTTTAIYEFVRNEFQFTLYHGARSNSTNVFLARRGNDVDLASVLIAMLRSRGVPARYAVGVARADAIRVANWLGVSDVALAHALLVDQGIQSAVLDGPTQTIEFEHVWVQALVAIDDYRGAATATSVDCASQPASCRWVNLDPSFKDTVYAAGSIDVHEDLTFDYDAFYHALLPTYVPASNPEIVRKDKNPMEIYEEQILAHLRSSNPGRTLEDVADVHEVVRDESGLIPTSLPFALVSGPQSFGSVAEHDAGATTQWAKYVHLKIYWRRASPGIPEISFNAGTFNLADLSTKRLTISYEYGTPSRMVTRLGGVEVNVPLVVGSLIIGGQVVGTGFSFDLEVTMDGPPAVGGSDEDLEVAATYPKLVVGGFFDIATGGENSNWSQVHRAARLLLAANEQFKIVRQAGPQQVPYVDANGNGVIDSGEVRLIDDPVALGALTGGLLYSAHTLYFARVHDTIRRVSALNHVATPIVGFLGVVSTVYGVKYVDGTPFSVVPDGLLIDMRGIQVNGSWRTNALAQFSNKTIELVGASISSLEHEIWEVLTGFEGLSTMNGIQKALQAGHTLQTLTNAQSLNTWNAYLAFGFRDVWSPPPGVTAQYWQLFGHWYWSFLRSSGGPPALDVISAYVNQATPNSRRIPRLGIPLAQSGVGGQVLSFHDVFRIWYDAQQAIYQQYQTTGSVSFSCGGYTYTNLSAALLLAEYCFYNDMVSRYGDLGVDYLDYFDETTGFLNGPPLLRRNPRASLDDHSTQFVANRRDDVYLGPAAFRRILQIPSRKTAPTGYRFQVYIDKLVEVSTNWTVALNYIITNDALGAGGGWVSGTAPLRLSDTSVFNNTLLTDRNLISTTNNDRWRAPSTADPISTVTGNMYHDATDVRIRGRGLDYTFTRTYNSGPTWSNPTGVPMGQRWSHSYAMRLVANDHTQQPNASDPTPSNVSSITYVDERGGEALFGISGSGPISGRNVVKPRGKFEELDLDEPNQTYVLRFRNEVEYVFADADLAVVGAVARLKKIREPHGAELSFTYHPTTGNLISITDNLGIAGRTGLVLEYWPDNRLRTIRDWTSREWNFTYDSSGNLESITNPLLETTTYEYAPAATHNLTAVVLPEDRNGAAPGGRVRTNYAYYRNGKAFRNFDSYGSGETVDYDLYRKRTRVTDPRGFVRSHVYDRDGQLTKLEEPDGGVLLFKHTAADGLRFQKRDALGYATNYSYNAVGTIAGCDQTGTVDCQATAGGNIIVEQDALLGETRYSYGLMDQVTVARDKRGNVTTRTYYTTNDDGSGARRGKLRRVDATLEGVEDQPLEEFTWNQDGTVRRHTEYIIPGNTSRQRRTDYFYEPGYDGLRVSAIVTAGSGRTIERIFTYDALGRIETETLYRQRTYDDPNPLELTTTYEYDALGRVTAVVDPLGNRRETDFDANGQVAAIRNEWKRPDNSFEVRTVATRFYDEADRMIEERDALGNPTRYTYDASGNVTAVTDANGNVSRFEYDSMGRRTAAIDANGHRSETEYDLAGRVLKTTDANGNATSYTYDPLGRLLTVTNALLYRTRWEYDEPNGDFVEETNANADVDASQRNSYGATTRREFDEFNRTRRVYDAAHGGTSSVTTYTYDLLGNILTVTDAEGNVTTMTYDDMGELTRVADAIPDPGTDRVTTFEYDEARNRIRSIDRMGQETRYTYDELNRLRLVDLRADPTLNETFTYDHRGDLTGVQNAAVTYTFGYDAKHRLLSKEDRRGTITRALSWTYDAVGNVKTKTNYAGELTEYQYDSTNRLVSLRNRDYLSVSYQYDPAGRLLNRILSNGLQTDYTYDAANRLTSLVNRTPAGVVESNVYGRDRVGNITSVNASTPLEAASFGYDKLHRLRMANYPGTANDRCYTYDRVGNRKRETQGNVTNCLSGTAPTPTYSYDHDADNRLTYQRQGTGTTQLARFDYDHNGNLTSRWWGTPSVLVETRTYDPKNRLKGLVRGALQPTFRYDPLDYRIEKATSPGNARHYYLEGEHLEMVTDVNQSVLGKYLRGVVIDEIVNGYERPLASNPYSVWNWQHDAVGSVTQLVGHEGTVESTQRYLPFGEKTLSPQLTSFFGYTGREIEEENGTYYYRARYYDPALGRFLSEDPIAFGGGINFYAYVGNNPLIATDPRGQAIETPWDVFNVGLGAGSLGGNLVAGNYGWAAVDAVALGYDLTATTVPFLPAGASAGLRALRTGNNLYDSARVGMDVARTADIANTAAQLAPTAGNAMAIGRQIHASVGSTLEQGNRLSGLASNAFRGSNGRLGPRADLSWPGSGLWADLTTQGSWMSHITRYGNGGIPLIYERGVGLTNVAPLMTLGGSLAAGSQGAGFFSSAFSSGTPWTSSIAYGKP